MKFTSPFVVASSLAALMMIACTAAAPDEAKDKDKDGATGGTTAEAQTSPGGTNNGTTATPGASSSSSSSSGDASTKPAEGGACAGEATATACWTCCENKSPGYAAAVIEASKKYQQCVCEPSRCADVCKTDLCTNPDPDAEVKSKACNECIGSDKTTACDEALDKAWNELEKNPLAMQVAACELASKCDDKPGGGEEGEEAEEIDTDEKKK